jgi:hypothetical protein
VSGELKVQEAEGRRQKEEGTLGTLGMGNS